MDHKVLSGKTWHPPGRGRYIKNIKQDSSSRSLNGEWIVSYFPTVMLIFCEWKDCAHQRKMFFGKNIYVSAPVRQKGLNETAVKKTKKHLFKHIATRKCFPAKCLHPCQIRTSSFFFVFLLFRIFYTIKCCTSTK